MKTAGIAALFGVASAIGNSRDNSTYANIDEVVSNHISLDFTVDFDSRKFIGNSTIHLTSHKDNLTNVFFDAWGIDIYNVYYSPANDTLWNSVNFTMSTPNPNIGDAVNVTLNTPLADGDEFKIFFDYSTNENGQSINWLTKEQTAGKKMPYLFS